MLHAITSFLTFWSTPKRLLLPAPTQLTIVPLSPDDVPTLWNLLVPGSKDQLVCDYRALSYRDACEHLHDAIYALQTAGATVRSAFLCEAGDGQAQRFPALPVGLLKLYSELPDKARSQRYAPIQRFHRDEKGWLWAALLLAERNPRREVIVTPAPVPAPVPVAAPVPVLTFAGSSPDEMLNALMRVPPQPTYPAPTQVTDDVPLRADSPAITQPLPLDDEADEQEPTADEDEQVIIETRERKTKPASAPALVPVAPAADDDLDDWLDLDEPKAPRIKLSALLASDNIAFIGPKGSGKTTALLTAVKHRQGEVIALDPHATPDKWPCRTLGNGRNYALIRRAFKALQQKMAARFDEIGNGTRGERYYQRPERRRTLVSDEFRSTVKGVPPIKAVRERGVEVEPAELGAGDYLLERISEGRKVGECVLIACHNDTNEALGLPTGAADMKTCFDYFVYCGGMALERYERRGKAKHDALNELRAMRYPAIVWHTERNTWALLDFDLAPVLPPDDEDKDDEDGDVLVLDEPSVVATPVRVQLSPEEIVRKVAKLKGIALPVARERVSDPALLPVLKIAKSRGLSDRAIARLVFDQENNGSFKQDKLKPVLEQLDW